MQVKKAHGKTLTKMREGFETNLSELRARCDARLASLEDDLELRRKVSTAVDPRNSLAPFGFYQPSHKAESQVSAAVGRRQSMRHPLSSVDHKPKTEPLGKIRAH